MLDWDQKVNAWDSVLSAGVQTLVVVIAAVLTWWITRASERRSSRAERRRFRVAQLDAFNRDLDSAGDRIRRMLSRRKVSERDLEVWNRFVNRSYWESEPEEQEVDTWLRTKMALVFTQAITTAQLSERDEYAEHLIREELHEIGTAFLDWRENKIGPAWFAEDLEAMGPSFRVYNGRFGSPDDSRLTRGQVVLDIVRRARRELKDAGKYPWRLKR